MCWLCNMSRSRPEASIVVESVEHRSTTCATAAIIPTTYSPTNTTTTIFGSRRPSRTLRPSRQTQI
jgi:hypothetical protein